MLRLGTVFSGIGSVEHALQRMEIRHKIVFACDNNKWVKESYFANYDINDDRWFDDVADIDGKKYKKKLDLLGYLLIDSANVRGILLGKTNSGNFLFRIFLNYNK